MDLIRGLQIIDNIDRLLRINYDNKAIKLFSKNNHGLSKSKHIDIKFLVVKKRVQSGQMTIEHISIDFILADLLTKGLPPKVFRHYVLNMRILLLNETFI